MKIGTLLAEDGGTWRPVVNPGCRLELSGGMDFGLSKRGAIVSTEGGREFGMRPSTMGRKKNEFLLFFYNKYK